MENVDIELLRTFLELERTRHFGRTADNLFLSQSSVSARIKALEETLGTTLFVRRRNDLQLTPAGERLKRHARLIVDAWMRARQDLSLGVEDEGGALVTLGAGHDLWEFYLMPRAPRWQEALPDLTLQLEAHGVEALTRRTLDGLLDLAFLFDPPASTRLEVREIATLNLRLYATDPTFTAEDPRLAEHYIRVDWGADFVREQSDRLPACRHPRWRVSHASLAVALMQRLGGAAYLPEEACRAGLHLIPDAPAFERRLYAIHRPQSEQRERLERLIELARGRPSGPRRAAGAAPAPTGR